MDKQELGPIMAKTYVAIRHNLEMTFELSTSVQAMILALQERVPGFQTAYANYFRDLTNGEFGRNNLEAIQQFDQVVARIEAGQF